MPAFEAAARAPVASRRSSCAVGLDAGEHHLGPGRVGERSPARDGHRERRTTGGGTSQPLEQVVELPVRDVGEEREGQVPLLRHGPAEPGLRLLPRADERGEILQRAVGRNHGDEHPHATTVTRRGRTGRTTASCSPTSAPSWPTSARPWLCRSPGWACSSSSPTARRGPLHPRAGPGARRLGSAVMGYRRFRANERAIRDGADIGRSGSRDPGGRGRRRRAAARPRGVPRALSRPARDWLHP